MNLSEQTLQLLLQNIAAKSPTPGGGAVASITAALAAALGQMVLNYSLGKKSLAAHDAVHRQSLESLANLGEEALNLAEADARAYARLNELWRLDANDPVRQREFSAAVDAAIAAPKAVLDNSLNMLRLLDSLAGKTSTSLNSDLAMAAILADAAARSAAWNVRINLLSLAEADRRRSLNRQVQQMLAECSTLCSTIENACAIRVD